MKDKPKSVAAGGNKKQATPIPAEKVSGVGPAIAERSKDAKVKGAAGRQPGAGKKGRG